MLTVADLMTPSPSTLTPDRPARDAVALMRQLRARHVPVLDAEGHLVGLVSDRDVLRHTDRHDVARLDQDDGRAEPLDGLLVRDLMTWVVQAVPSTLDATEAGQRLLDSRISCLPVVDDGALVGVLTESDFVRFVVRAFADDDE